MAKASTAKSLSSSPGLLELLRQTAPPPLLQPQRQRPRRRPSPRARGACEGRTSRPRTPRKGRVTTATSSSFSKSEQGDHFSLVPLFLRFLSLFSRLAKLLETMTITVGDVEAAISRAVDKVVEYGKVRKEEEEQKERKSTTVLMASIVVVIIDLLFALIPLMSLLLLCTIDLSRETDEFSALRWSDQATEHGEGAKMRGECALNVAVALVDSTFFFLLNLNLFFKKPLHPADRPLRLHPDHPRAGHALHRAQAEPGAAAVADVKEQKECKNGKRGFWKFSKSRVFFVFCFIFDFSLSARARQTIGKALSLSLLSLFLNG